MNNNKKKPARMSLLKYFLLFGFLWEFLGLLEKKEKIEKIEDNFKEYLKEEEGEIEDYIRDKEGFSKFMSHSGKLFAEFFIPSHGNGHKPKILRTRSLTLIVVVLALLKISIAMYVFYFTAYQAKMSENLTAQIFDLINRDRVSQNLEPLQINAVLNASAMSKAENMVLNNYFAHYSPDGKKPWDFIDRDSYAYLFVGENLAMNFTSAESAHQALMLSPSHKENIMSDRYRDVGLAMVNGEIAGKNTNILVQLFAVKKEPDVRLAVVTENPVVAITEAVAPAPIDIKPAQITKPAPAATISAPAKTETIKTPAVPVLKSPETEEAKNVPVAELAKILEMEKKIPPLPSVPAPENSLAETAPRLAQAEISPNEKIENNAITQVKSFDNVPEEDVIAKDRRMKLINNLMFGMMAVLFLLLLANIIIKAEIQHKPVIFQTMLAIFCLSCLIYLNFNFLENILPKLFVV